MKIRYFILFIAMVVATSFTACSYDAHDSASQTASENQSQNAAQVSISHGSTPTETFENAFATLKSEVTDFSQYINYPVRSRGNYVEQAVILFQENMDQDFINLVNLLSQSLEYEINGEAINGNNAIVSVTITNRDYSSVDYFSDSLFDDLAAVGEQMITFNLDIELEKVNDVWIIQMDDELQSAISGGLFKSALETFDDVLNGIFR